MPSFRPANHRLHWTLGLLALLVVFLSARWHVRDLDRSIRREGLSSQTYVAARSVLLDLLDVETGLRGYLIADREDYLRPYHEGLGRLADDLARLRARVGSDPEESPQVSQAAEMADGIVREFAGQVGLAEDDGVEAARRRFLDSPTKPAMDEVRARLRIVQAQEQARLEGRNRAVESHLATTLWLLDASSALILLVVLCLATGFLRPATVP